MDHPNWFYQGFRNAIFDCNLGDLPLIGYQFTWSMSKGSPIAVEEGLDRAMFNPRWREVFPEARLLNLVAPISDHILLWWTPILPVL